MKHIFCRAGRLISFGVFVAACHFAVTAQAQTTSTTTVAPVTTLPAEYRVLDTSGNFVLTLPNNPSGRTRFRIGLFRVGQTEKLAETRRDFAIQNGALSASFHLEAPPGDYDLRILSDDNARTPLSIVATVTISGVRRAPGWWLFNGQPFVAADTKTDSAANVSTPNVSTPSATTPNVSNLNAPLFIAGLKRDFSNKPKAISRDILSNTLLQYRVLELPQLSEMSAPNYDFAALRTKIIAQMKDARKSGQRNLAGFELSLGVTNRNLIDADAKVVVGRLRRVLNEVAPAAALILTTCSTEA